MFDRAWRHRWLPLSLLLVVVPAHAQETRKALEKIVQNCLAPEGDRHDCPAPRVDGDDLTASDCRYTTYVWEQSRDYVVMRDREMCNCPPSFVHGLALPFSRVSGIEADKPPEGIWRFAWEAAHAYIDDELAIALVVNSRQQRTQDYLHVHIVRLRDGARMLFSRNLTVDIPTLDDVWSVGKQAAAWQRFADYGLLVVKNPMGGFTVLLQPGIPTTSAETGYTIFRCR